MWSHLNVEKYSLEGGEEGFCEHKEMSMLVYSVNHLGSVSYSSTPLQGGQPSGHCIQFQVWDFCVMCSSSMRARGDPL